MSTYRCEYCRATFEHPGSEECETVGTHCEHLMNAGWRPVWLRAMVERSPSLRRRRIGRPRSSDRHIFSRGGWICVQCAKTFLVTRGAPQEARKGFEFRKLDHPVYCESGVTLGRRQGCACVPEPEPCDDCVRFEREMAANCPPSGS